MSFGRPYILRTDGCIHDGWLVLSPKSNRVSSDYFYYYLGSPVIKRKLAQRAAGAVVKNLNSDIVRDLDILVPPMEAQKRIAAILDKADAIRRKRQQAIQLADEFLRSVFLEMFGDPALNLQGWAEFAVGDSVEEIVAGWSAKGDSSPAHQDQMGVLKISAVTSGEFLPTENKAVERDAVPVGKTLVMPKKGDLLFSRANTRELVAATALVDKDYENLFLPDKLWRIRFTKKMLPEFFHFMLQQPRMRTRLTSRATGTSGSMLNVSKKKFEETLAIRPPLKEQQRFVNAYRRVRSYRQKNLELTRNSDDLFASLSKRAFQGEL
jgi:type I restriction enzyme S subunit